MCSFSTTADSWKFTLGIHIGMLLILLVDFVHTIVDHNILVYVM